MLKIKEAIVVEGRYDKNTLSQLVDTMIIETKGFGIFKDNERLSLLRRVARERGLVVLTDSDGAGFVIRNFLKGAIPRQPGKEGKLGVEGMRPRVLEEALRRSGATFLDQEPGEQTARRAITKADLFSAGLSGGPDSASRRQTLLRRLDLPEHMTANAMLEALNVFCTYEEFQRAVSDLETAGKQ